MAKSKAKTQRTAAKKRKKVASQTVERPGSLFGNKHSPGDYLVIGFVALCGIAVLILLASYFTASGNAVANGAIDSQTVVQTVAEDSVFYSGSGTMKCNYLCGKENKFAVVSSVDGQTVANDEVVNGEWTCLCAGG